MIKNRFANEKDRQAQRFLIIFKVTASEKKEKNPIITYSYVKRNEKFLRIMRISFPFRTEGAYYRDDYFLLRFSNLPISSSNYNLPILQS